MSAVGAGMDIVLITNSPGELSSWVRMTAEELRAKAPGVRLIVMLVPCPYASGREEAIAKSYAAVDVVVPPGDFLAFLCGLRIKSYRPADRGVVVFLGGDLWHAALVARRLKFPAVAYTLRASSWNKAFQYLCVPDDQVKAAILARRGVPEDRVRVVGNLTIEGVRPSRGRDESQRAWGLNPDALTVGILPGSRLYHVHTSLPVFLKVAEEIAAQIPRVQFLLGLSPFITLQNLQECLSDRSSSGIDGSTGALLQSNGECAITTTAGVSIKVLLGQQYDLMNVSDLVVTIPGTNTAEIAFLGRPMIVASTWKAKIPRGGLGGIIGALPLVAPIRRQFIKSILRSIKFTALPNQMAQREVVPEVLVEHHASEISNVAVDLLSDGARRRRMADELKGLMGSGGAAARLADLVLAAAQPEAARS